MNTYINQILTAVKLDKPETELRNLLYGIFRDIEDRYRISIESGYANETRTTERPDRDNKHIPKPDIEQGYIITDEDKEDIKELVGIDVIP